MCTRAFRVVTLKKLQLIFSRSGELVQYLHVGPTLILTWNMDQ